LRTRLAQNARRYAETELSQDVHAQRLATAIAAISAHPNANATGVGTPERSSYGG
jgi:hypothetical protein